MLWLRAVMALIGCEGCGRTVRPLKYIKKCPPTQNISLFLHSSTSTRTSVAYLKERFFFRVLRFFLELCLETLKMAPPMTMTFFTDCFALQH